MIALAAGARKFSPEKNIQLLPGVMQILANDKTHDFRLLIAGDGPKKDFLEKIKGLISRKNPKLIHL